MKLNNLKNIFFSYRTPILYTGGAMLQSITQLIVGFVIARFIPPEDLGLWTTLNLAVTYTSFLQAGLISGLNRELPYSYGEGKYQEAENMAGTVQSITVLTTILLLCIGLSFFFLYQFDDNKIKYGVIAVTLYIIFLFFQNYFTSTYRSKNSFIVLSKIQIFNALLNVLSIIVIVYFAYYGLILKTVIVSGLFTLHLYLSRPIKVGFVINRRSLIKILKTGLPIWGLAYIESLASTFDKILLLKFSDLSNVGLYTFAYYGYSFFLIFSTTVGKYISPRMSYKYGVNNDKKKLWNYFKKITLLIVVIQAILAIIGVSILPFLVSSLFPQYVGSTKAMQILVFAGMSKGSIVGVNVLISIKSMKHLSIYQISYSVLLVLCPLIGILSFDNPIIGVSFGLLFSNAFNFVVGFYVTYIATRS